MCLSHDLNRQKIKWKWIFSHWGVRASILNFTKGYNRGEIMKTRIWSYLAHLKPTLKIFDTIIITFKSWRKQNTFSFFIWVEISELLTFLHFWRILTFENHGKTKKRQYLLHLSSKWKKWKHFVSFIFKSLRKQSALIFAI